LRYAQGKCLIAEELHELALARQLNAGFVVTKQDETDNSE